MGIFMNTRHSGSESGHVTAELEAMTNEATLGAGNYVFEAGNKFAITVTPVTGDINISNGVFSWCGRLGGVESFATAKYTPPSSETLYKKVVVGARYTKNSSTLVENISLEVFESDVQASESAAAGFTLSLDSAEIKPDTTSAYLPLWEFVASSKAYNTPTQLFKTINDISFIVNKMNGLQTTLNQEITNRIDADKSLNTSINSLQRKWEVLRNSSITNGVSVTIANLTQYTFLAVMITMDNDSAQSTPHIIPVLDGDYYFKKVYYKKPTLASWEIEQYYRKITISGNKVTFGTNQSALAGFVTEIYGIK